jgi:hypothetical protein
VLHFIEAMYPYINQQGKKRPEFFNSQECMVPALV